MKIRTLLLRMIQAAAFVWACPAMGGESFSPIPNDVQIADTHDLLARAGHDRIVRNRIPGMHWPTKRERDRYRPPQEDVRPEIRTQAAKWLRRAIKPEWVPLDLEERLIPMRGYPGGSDSFIVRYAKGRKRIQIFSGGSFVFLVSDPDYPAPTGKAPANFDLGARRYLNLPRGLGMPPGDSYHVWAMEEALPRSVAPGVWLGFLGSPLRHPIVHEIMWYEDSFCLWWDTYFYIEARRWRTYYPMRKTPVHGWTRESPADPDWQEFSRDKYYVLFGHPPQPSPLQKLVGVLFSKTPYVPLTMVLFGFLAALVWKRNTRRGIVVR